MTLSQEIKISLKDESTTMFNPEYSDSNRDLTNDEYTIQRIAIADATSDQAIDFGGISSATFIAIVTDQTISFKLNGTSNLAITAKSAAPTVLNTDSITSLYVSNSSGSTANVTIIIANQSYS